MAQWFAIDGGDVALELRILAGLAVDCELGFENQAFVAFCTFGGLAERGTNELRLGGIEVLTQLRDEMD